MLFPFSSRPIMHLRKLCIYFNISAGGDERDLTARLSDLRSQFLDKLCLSDLDVLSDKSCLPSLNVILHLSSRLSQLSLQDNQGHELAPKMLNTSQQNSESACMTAQYTLKDASLSFHFFYATMTRYDYILYFQNSEYHPPIMVDANKSNKIDSRTVRITFSKSQDYNLVMRLEETDLMLQDPSVRAVACDSTLLHRDIIPSTAVYTTSHTVIAELPLIFAQFGPVLTVLKTTKPSSNIIVFFSTDSAQRAMKHNFPKSYIHVAKYVRFSSNSKERLHRIGAKHKSTFRAGGTKEHNNGPHRARWHGRSIRADIYQLFFSPSTSSSRCNQARLGLYIG
jgi:hypothetical protein